MNSIRQMLRLPVKFLSGVLIVSLTVAVVCVCVGQSIAASATADNLDYIFTTVALPSRASQFIGGEVKYYYNALNDIWFPSVRPKQTLDQEFTNWLETTAEQYPDIVTSVTALGLASAQIPELTIDNYTQYRYQNTNIGGGTMLVPSKLTAVPEGSPYSCAMLEITLLRMGTPHETSKEGYRTDGTAVCVTENVKVELLGRIENVVGLHEGFRDPTGWTAYLTLVLPDLTSWEELSLVEGGRYLVYGIDYYDMDWELRGYISSEMGLDRQIEELDPERIVLFCNEELPLREELAPVYRNVGYYEHDLNAGLDTDEERLVRVDLGEGNAWGYHAVSLTLEDKSRFPTLRWVDCDSETQGYPVLNWDRVLTDKNGRETAVTQEEYASRYAMPTIVKLEGTAQEFLSSDQGSVWQQKLEELCVNHHVFPVIGVEKLSAVADFAMECAGIAEGRDFTKEELEEGGKVCVISQHLAQLNGLKVGDTLTLNYYNYDYSSPYQAFLSGGSGTVRPTAYLYMSTTTFEGEAAEYTIVGLYSQDGIWENVNENFYSFTPNTIFVPEKSVVSDMDYSHQAFFGSVLLKNGTVSAFRELVEQAGYEEAFEFFDQGYSDVSDDFYNYEDMAFRVQKIGLLIYGIVLVVFLLLYPGSQQKNLNIMSSMGANRMQKIGHILANGCSILLPGSLIGAGIASILWASVVDMLAAFVEAEVDFSLDVVAIGGIAFLQLILAVILLLVVAVVMTIPGSLMKRK